MGKFTSIFWDVDNTLLDFPYSQRHALKTSLEAFGYEMTEEMLERYSAINESFWKRLELGEITQKEMLPGRFIQLFQEFHITGVEVEDFRAIYQRELGSVYCYKDDSLSVCQKLHTQVKQYVITNGVSATQRNKLKLSGLADLMDGIFISEEIGTPKPHREFFERCLEQVEEKDKSRILIVGDSLSSDIKGGVLAGLPTCWYRPEGTPNPTEYRPDYEISDLHEIFSILE